MPMASQTNQPAPDAEAQEPRTGDTTIMPARFVFPSTLPIIPLTRRPLFPKMMTPLMVEDEHLRHMALEVSRSASKFVGLVLVRATEGPEPSPPHPADMHSVGVIAEILQVGTPTDGQPLQVMAGVLDRFTVVRFAQEAPHMIAEVRYVIEPEAPIDDEMKAYSLSIITAIKELIHLNPLFKEELNLFLNRSNLNEPGRLADFAAAMTTARSADLQEILETFNIRQRIEKVLLLLKKEIDISKLQVRISKQIEEKLSKQQREFFLREQLKAIKKELGLAKDEKDQEAERFREKIRQLHLPPEAKERIDEEMEKLSLIEPTSPEYTVTRNYLDWLTALPWGVHTDDRFDIAKAQRILDHDHYGLQDVKERILEFLSVGIMKGRISGTILCFVGPPGVGKTSLGQSIARSIGRRFYRFSLGGMRDEAEIKGHRRTYIGALPGKFIQAIKVCKSDNPIIMLDEIDKIGASYHGDPASALLEVLDPEQNKDFLDHYIDVRFDLSSVFFICTANVTDTIPSPLLDRMEIIKLPGYIVAEKIQIARRHLIPKQLAAHGLKSEQVRITGRALREIADGYAREPGVRALENHIKKILRKSARRIVEKKVGPIVVDAADVPANLGKRLFSLTDPYLKRRRPGVAMGLAWTSLGGETMYIEATPVASDKPGFKQTGQLGSVMVESSEIAYTFVRSFLTDDPAARTFFERSAIHLHVPAGATPKDGPSAGITMAIALYSLVTGRPVRTHTAMTGELTLSGLVMPIGGVKEKTIAAKRGGVVNLIFPKENEKDFEELPAYIRKGLKPHFVEVFAEVVEACFPPARPARTAKPAPRMKPKGKP